jgi:hypothetical protein
LTASFNLGKADLQKATSAEEKFDDRRKYYLGLVAKRLRKLKTLGTIIRGSLTCFSLSDASTIAQRFLRALSTTLRLFRSWF